MTDRYVDTVIGASATYDPVARSAIGGTDVSYATLALAWAACANNDTIYLRAGGESIAVALSLGTTTGVTISPYEEETYTITQTADAGGITFAAVNTTIALGDGNIKIIGTSAVLAGSTRAALTLSAAGFTVIARTGHFILDWYRVAILTNSLQTFILDNMVFDSCTTTTRTSQDGTVMTLNNPVYIYTGHRHALGALTLTLNNPTIIESNATEFFEGFASGETMTVTVNNPLAIGLGTVAAAVPYQVLAGTTMDIYGGIVHSGIKTNSRAVAAGGTLTEQVAVDTSTFVRFKAHKNHKCYVTLYLTDGRQADTATPPLSTYIAAAATHGVSLSFLPDDTYTMNPGVGQNAYKATNIAAWLAAGHELGSGGNYGDSWTSTPFILTYTGPRTGVKLVVSDSGTSWAIMDGETVLGSWDCSYGATNQYLGVYQSTAGTPDDSVLCQIKALSVDGDTFAVSATGGWDDSHALVIEDGTYTMYTSGVAMTPSATVNFARRAERDIAAPNATLLATVGYAPKVYLGAGQVYSSDLATYLEANGFVGCLQYNYDLNTPIYSADPYALGFGIGVTEFITAIGGDDSTATEANIRAWVRRVASFGFAKSAYIPIQISGPSSGDLDQTRLEWLIDEFINCGVEIVTVEEAAALVGTAEPATSHDYTLADCDAVGMGYKYWDAGTRPVAANAEPRSDHTDPGAFQSTLGPWHPAQL